MAGVETKHSVRTSLFFLVLGIKIPVKKASFWDVLRLRVMKTQAPTQILIQRATRRSERAKRFTNPEGFPETAREKMTQLKLAILKFIQDSQALFTSRSVKSPTAREILWILAEALNQCNLIFKTFENTWTFGIGVIGNLQYFLPLQLLEDMWPLLEHLNQAQVLEGIGRLKPELNAINCRVCTLQRRQHNY